MKSVNKTMIESAIKLAREVKAGCVLVCVDVKSELAELPEDVKTSVHFILVTREDEDMPEKSGEILEKTGYSQCEFNPGG